MGVPESQGSTGPAKKRQRLSLKSIKKKVDSDVQQKQDLVTMEKESEEERPRLFFFTDSFTSQDRFYKFYALPD